MLDPHSDKSKVLWIFSHLKDDRRLTLTQNPHFYKGLPILPQAYGDEFQMDPIETFQHERISVLVDNPRDAGRVFLEIAGQRRAFGNVWHVRDSDAIIFKGPCESCLFYVF